MTSPEPESAFLETVDLSQGAFDALCKRIEDDTRMCKELGGAEDGLLHLEVTTNEWMLLVYHLLYHPHRGAPALGANSHDYWTEYGKVRLYTRIQ